MREIKFKAFHKSSKKIFDVYSFTDTEVIENSTDGIFTSDTLPALREECELLQYTELKDCTKFEELSEQEQQFWLIKNKKEDWKGKEIYEGDILSFDFSEDHKNKDYSKPIYVVQLFKDVFPCATGIHDNLYAHWHRLPFTKVLGNIHQNSELLEKNK